MRHNKKINHLGRTHSHRLAMLSNMAASLILHKRIFTTTAKAKALRKYVEPLITKSKDSASKSPEDVVHSRRIVFASLQNKYAVKELFQTVSEKIGDRPGGYTRIIKTGNRLGDNAAMCFIELVDFNEHMLKETKKTAKTRRSSRRGSKKAAETTAAPAEETIPTPAAETEVEVAAPEATEETLVAETEAVADETAEEEKDAE